jgi:hypothetical protein
MTTIGEKAAHVRAELAQATPTKHHCHWPSCTRTVPPAAWGCKPHWYALPKVLRDKIWAAYRPGQEQSKTPSRRYVEVAREVQEWIAANAPGRQGDLLDGR